MEFTCVSLCSPNPPRKLQDLALSADQRGINFSGKELHYVYFQVRAWRQAACITAVSSHRPHVKSKFARRGLLLFSIVDAFMVRPDLRTSWVYDAFTRLANKGEPHTGTPLRVVSLGGGPGTDASGLVMATRLHFGRPIVCQLLDFEATWRRYTKTLNSLFAPHVTVSFDRCDVTQPLTDTSNIAVLTAAAASADVYIFSYVCNETSSKARAGGLAFYRDLAQQARPGALFLFVDVHTHSASTLTAVQDIMVNAMKTEIPFRVWRPPHDNFVYTALHQPCEVLLLQKPMLEDQTSATTPDKAITQPTSTPDRTVLAEDQEGKLEELILP